MCHQLRPLSCCNELEEAAAPSACHARLLVLLQRGICVSMCVSLHLAAFPSFHFFFFFNNWAEMAWLVFQGTKYIYSELNSLSCSPSIVLGQCPNYTLDLLPAICILTRALWLCLRKNRVMSGLWQGCSLFFSWYPFRRIVRHKADGVPVCGRQSVLVAQGASSQKESRANQLQPL